MTVRKILACATMLVGAVGCQQPMGQHEVNRGGRYQLSEDQRYLYITDTATGKVWHRGIQPRDGETWEPLGGPTTQP